MADSSQQETHLSKIGSGRQHNLALTSSGLVLSWGGGEYGQLGHGSIEMETVPGVIGFFLDLTVEDVFCGADSSYAVVRTAEDQQLVYSWGWGWEGRLGHEDRGDMPVPRQVSALQGMQVHTLACGDAHVLAIVDDGDLYSFGRNTSGQVGVGNASNHVSPTIVSALAGSRVISVACGAEHSVAATASGQVYAWGWGRYGNIGDGSTSDRYLPVEVQGLEGTTIAKVAAGWRHSMALTTEGAPYIWGWNKYGQLGLGDFNDRLTAESLPVPSGRKAKILVAGWRHTAMVDEDGKLFTWGWNGFGQLGNGNKVQQNSPQQVQALAEVDIRLVACGWRHTVAYSSDGELYSWGIGASGQLGTGQMLNSLVPVKVSMLSKPNLVDNSLKKTVVVPAVDDIPSELQALLGGDLSLDDTFDMPRMPGESMGSGPDAKRSKRGLGEGGEL